MGDYEDQLDLPIEGVEVTNEEISFNDDGTVNDDVYVEEVAAPEYSAVVVEEEPVYTEEVVEETVPAPVAVVEEPEPIYNAPIEEPVHHVRWPWALLALPLLAIPFIPRHHAPVAEVKVTPVVTARPTVAPTRAAATPVCNGTWTVNGSVVLRETAKESGKALETLKSGTAVDVTSAAEAGYYKVKVGSETGYVPVNVVVCATPTKAPAPAPAPARTTPAPATAVVTG